MRCDSHTTTFSRGLLNQPQETERPSCSGFKGALIFRSIRMNKNTYNTPSFYLDVDNCRLTITNVTPKIVKILGVDLKHTPNVQYLKDKNEIIISEINPAVVTMWKKALVTFKRINVPLNQAMINLKQVIKNVIDVNNIIIKNFGTNTVLTPEAFNQAKTLVTQEVYAQMYKHLKVTGYPFIKNDRIIVPLNVHEGKDDNGVICTELETLTIQKTGRVEKCLVNIENGQTTTLTNDGFQKLTKKECQACFGGDLNTTTKQ